MSPHVPAAHSPQLAQFLGANLLPPQRPVPEEPLHKPGVSSPRLLDGLPPDEISSARLAYMRNLSLLVPVEFSVPSALEPPERALMFLSFGAYGAASSVLGPVDGLHFVGAAALSRGGAAATVLVAVLDSDWSVRGPGSSGAEYITGAISNEAQHTSGNTSVIRNTSAISNGAPGTHTRTNSPIPEFRTFHTAQYTFPDVAVARLNEKEILFLYIKIREIQAATDMDECLKQARMRAVLERMLFEGVEEMGWQYRRVAALLKAEILDECRLLERVCEDMVGGDVIDGNSAQNEISSIALTRPVILGSELEIQLARGFMKSLDFGAAYKILMKYPLRDEKISCLICLKRPEEAVREIEEYVAAIGDPDTREQSMKLASLYIQLGHLRQDPRYFDRAGDVFHSARPFHVKGLWLYARQRHEEAVEALQQAHRISPSNEDVRFALGSALLSSERYSEALKVFRLLKAENPKNENIAKSLSYCYYKMEDLEGTLSSLRAVALHDPAAMRQFLLLSIKNAVRENVSWALGRMALTALLCDSVEYVLQEGLLSREELRAVLSGNPHIETEELEKLLQRRS